MAVIPYPRRRPPRHEIRQIRGLGIRIARWGDESASPVILLHGWQDTSDTFQFLIDTFEEDWPIAALDWRGFGASEWARDGYWFPDYLADLDALLDLLTPELPARLVGHSMGGNVAWQYAGLRPERVRCVVSLEGFGMASCVPEQAPERLRTWLGQVKTPAAGKSYDSLEQLASVIRFRYPRLNEVQSGFVASAWSSLGSDGRVRLLGDPRHRWVNPTLYRREDAEACWRLVAAPLLLVLGEESEYLSRLGVDGTEAALRLAFPRIDIARVAAVGHMLHLERPDLVAPLIETFLRAN